MSDAPARKYDPIAVSSESTVVAEYVADPLEATAYQSEADLEREMIRLLQSQAYEYLPITTEAQLIANLRAQLELLNDITFSDGEWERFFTTKVASKNDGIVEKAVRIQEDHVQVLKRDDGSTKNIALIDKANIHNNRLQVINQYEIGKGDPSTGSGAGAKYANRYDVTVLVNGLPMVHIELKRRGVDIREAFNQIDRYQRDSFWADPASSSTCSCSSSATARSRSTTPTPHALDTSMWATRPVAGRRAATLSSSPRGGPTRRTGPSRS